jgi:hypothetical protein
MVVLLVVLRLALARGLTLEYTFFVALAMRQLSRQFC